MRVWEQTGIEKIEMANQSDVLLSIRVQQETRPLLRVFLRIETPNILAGC